MTVRGLRLGRLTALGLAGASLFGCSGTGAARAPAANARPGSGPVLFAPSLAGVDARLLPELERIQGLVTQGNYAAARSVLDQLRTREQNRLSGPALDVVLAYERMLDLDPSFLPSLQALASAVESGADREAAAILRRIELRQPRGSVLDIVQAYRRILDGRAVVSNLRLRLECRPEPVGEIPEGAPAGARFARLFLVAESGLEESVSLETGPATLFVTRSVVGRTGIERDAVETRTFDNLHRLEVGPGGPAEISLARFFVSAAEGEIASRMRFELELRSGSAWILTAEQAAARASGDSKAGAAPAGREVPVMRLRVADAETTAYETALIELPPAAPEDLMALASAVGKIEVAAALRVAVRIPPNERERTLDLLAPQIEALPEDAVRALVPSLRWIAVTSEPGGSPAAWRAWFVARERKKSGERPKLLLPRTAPGRANP